MAFFEVAIIGEQKLKTPAKDRSFDIPIIGQREPAAAPAPIQTIEVCRSFAYKLNLQNYGGKQYESIDLFASRKITCGVDDQKWVSEQIFEECVEEVRTTREKIIERIQQGKAERKKTA